MRMALPQGIDTDFGCTAAQVLGWRAHWLHKWLTGNAASALTDRDRAVLTLVVTSPAGITTDQLITALRVGGVSKTAGAACITRLVQEGWLRQNDDVIDLPEADIAWIADHIKQ